MQYRAYTKKFDRVVQAEQLDEVLGPLPFDGEKAVESAWQALQTDLLPWRTRVHIAASAASTRIRARLTSDQRSDTAVTLLLDQSGSMRGQKMLFAAATADVVQEFLLTLGLNCEVLGFTTSQWKGGRSRGRWTWRFRPKQPGRLNDLLHIIYRDASDKRASTGSYNFRPMLRSDLPKENVDGEAIEWAAERLGLLNAKRKILIVLSDGAPVDDSTLMENDPSYLSDHLRTVVGDIAAAGQIRIAALGIGYRVHEFYPASAWVEAPDELGMTLIDLIEELLLS